MSDDLRKLIEAVEAGDLSATNNILGIMYSGLDNYWPWDWLSKVNSAFRGSLDAAISLREALLPGWAIASMTAWPGNPRTVTLWGTHEYRGERFHDFRDGRVYAEGPTLARALLLAVLRAKLMEMENE